MKLILLLLLTTNALAQFTGFPNGSNTPAILNAKGDLLSNNGTTDVVHFAGTAGQVLVIDLTEPSGLKWVTPVDYSSITTTLGDLILRGAIADERLAIGTNGQVLSSNGTTALWVDTSDTIYDPTTIQAEVDLNTAKVTDLVHPLVETAVPLGAVFTDTIYDDSTLAAAIALNTAKVTDLVHPLVETAVPLGAVFTDADTIYDDSTLAAAVALNSAKVTDLVHPSVGEPVPVGAVFTDTVYDDTVINSKVTLNTARQTEIDLNSVHRLDDGSQHAFINQDVSTTSHPTFADLSITGNIDIQGTTTTLNTATLSVEDTNITINQNGNDTTAEGAGITIDRASMNGSIAFEYILPSKFKVGLLGLEKEVVDVSSVQTLTNKIIQHDDLTNLQSSVIGEYHHLSDAEYAALGGAAFSEFTSLTDTPTNFTSASLKAVRVNAAETALEFYTPAAAGSMDFSTLTDTPASYNTASLKTVRVNASETGLEYYTPASSLPPLGAVADNALVRTAGLSGNTLQASNIIIDDVDNISGVGTLNTHIIPAGTGTIALLTDTVDAAQTVVFDARVDEVAGVAIGEVVYISGATGSQMEASLAINNDFTKIEAIAIATEVGVDNATISFQNFGELSGLNTLAFADGDKLYLGSTAGTLTNVHPSGIDAVMVIGSVVRSHATQGIIFIAIEHFTEASNHNGILRSQVVNTSAGTSASAAYTLVNDAMHRASVSMVGSGFTDVAGIAESLVIYNEGYNKTVNAVDGNFGFSWWTDVTDSHNLSSTEKMSLSATGELAAVSLNIGSSNTINEFSTDGTLAGNSDTAIPTEQAVKTYVDAATSGGGGTGDVVGPATSTANAIPIYADTTGKLLADSKVLIDADGRISQTGLGNSIFFGAESGLNDDGSANKNIGIGYRSLRDVTTASSNIAIGDTVLRNITSLGAGNVAIGHSIGHFGASTTGSNNTLVGMSVASGLTTGADNAIFGAVAQTGLTSGSFNSALGKQSGRTGLGNYNVNVGYKAGYGPSTGTHHRNVFVGSNTAASLTTGSDNILLGDSVDLPTGTTNFHLNIGNTITADMTTGKVTIGTLNLTGLPVHADEAAAAALTTGDVYQTVTGELRIKL